MTAGRLRLLLVLLAVLLAARPAGRLLDRGLDWAERRWGYDPAAWWQD